MGYIRRDALKNLSLYKYSAVDASYMSKYILQPYWKFCLEFLPRCIAPNLVTLIGSAALLINVITAYIYFPYLQGDAPGWVFLSFAFGVQWYSLMDNLDGKQARRTQNSSPLGELFDHGCDCLAVSLLMLVVCSSAESGTGLLPFLVLMIAEAGFWMATWEEYHTGSLYLGIINGPSEGLQLLSVIHMLRYFLGKSFFTKALFALPGSYFGFSESLDVTVTHVIFAIYGGGGIITILFNLASVLGKVKSSGKKKDALMGILSFAIIAICSVVWYSFSDLFAQDPYLFGVTIGLCIGELTSRLILAHVTLEPFKPIQRPHLFVFFPMVNAILATYCEWFIPQYYCLVGMFLVSVFLFAHYVQSVVLDICDYLDIYCLRINKPKTKAQ